jgi:N-acetylmuramoyl-L-alanine amidase
MFKPALQLITVLSMLTAALSPATAAHKTIKLCSLSHELKLTSIAQTSKQITWKADHTNLTFFTGSRKLLFNNTLFWLNDPLSRKGNTLRISTTDAETIIKPLLHPSNFLTNCKSGFVVLDPGHGGKDSGGIGYNSIQEKKVVLDISRRVARKLTAKGVRVRLTRAHDTFVDLSKRPRLATHWGADIFVSIHANKAGNTKANGIETFVIPAAGSCSTSSTKANSKNYAGNNHNAANTILAGSIHTKLLKTSKATDRGVKRARFVVIKNATCPAALVEVGFLTNTREGKKLNTKSYRDKLADGIATGILDYISQVKAAAHQKELAHAQKSQARKK